MSFTYDGEKPTTREGDDTDGVRTYSRVYGFIASSQLDDEYGVLTHTSTPQYGSVHPSDSGAWCNSRKAVCTDGWTGWTLYVTWSSKRELATDPTNDPAIITVSTEQFQKVADRDKDGYSICNSAGDPFDPPYMMDDSRRVIQIQKNMSSHPSWLLSYQDVVNSDVFVVKGISYAIGTGKVQRVSIGPTETRNGVPFVVVTVDIHCQRDGWILRPLDAGFREKSGTERINIVNDGDGLQPTSPVCLDGSGAVLANPTTTTAVYGAFTVYTTAAFNGNIPLT